MPVTLNFWLSPPHFRLPLINFLGRELWPEQHHPGPRREVRHLHAGYLRLLGLRRLGVKTLVCGARWVCQGQHQGCQVAKKGRAHVTTIAGILGSAMAAGLSSRELRGFLLKGRRKNVRALF